MSERQLEPTVNGQTFDEMVAAALDYTTIESAIDMARLAFGLGGDTPVDVTLLDGDTPSQRATGE